MTNRLAAWLAAILLAAIATDLIFNDGSALFFLALKFLDLIEWVAFWR